MALPDLVRRTAEKLISRYCREKIAGGGCQCARLSFRIRDDQITLFEERPACDRDLPGTLAPVAQFRFHHDLSQWTLHHPGPDRGWRFYLNAGPTLDLGKLLRHLDADPLRLFWG